MKIKKQGSAIWQGTIKEGGGKISTQSGALKEISYGFNTRFEGKPGTNPEELLGAAHASCFTMATSVYLSQAGFNPTRLETLADVTLEKIGEGFEITAIDLTLTAQVPELTQEKFKELTEKAKNSCPLSKVLKAPITLTATLS